METDRAAALTESLDWSDLRLILAICQTGSLSGAARTLKQHHSTVFRRINAIEDRTKVRFFERMPAGYKMTDAGAVAQQYGKRIEAEFLALGREILGQDDRLEGQVRLTSPQGISEQILPSLVAEFRADNPGISIQVVGAHAAMDLSRREADIAIRATRKPPETAVGRFVCDFRFAIYGSPDYLAARQGVPLAEHDWCLISGAQTWLIPLVWRSLEQATARTAYSATASMSVLNAAALGMGVTMMPCYLGDPAAGVVRIGKPLTALQLELWILTHADLRGTARIKALMTFLHDRLSERRALFEGKT